MARGQLSIRARLTLFFVLAIAAILAFTGVALTALVRHSSANEASNQIAAVMAQTQEHFVTQRTMPHHVEVLAMHDDVVVQVTNLAGTKVLAASSAITGAPVLAHETLDTASADGLGVRLITNDATRGVLAQTSYATVGTIATPDGPGLIFGFIYGAHVSRSLSVLLASLAVSFPVLLLVSGGLIWIGIGLALAPVEAIRRRVDAIAAEDLTQRVPLTGGDDEIARMARTVNAMLDRLESSSHFQQEFVSNVSHELRSPLTTLLTTTERAANDPDRADWPEVVEVVMREGRRLDVLIDDLFWLARHDENQVTSHSTDVDLDDLLFEEAQRVRLVSDLRVDTAAVTPTRVEGDPAMHKRMIRNVVDNASRYAATELRFESHYDGDYAVVTVADDGEGVDVAESDRLFERFVRADPARSRISGGTGLGLAIVNEIVTHHGGTARFVAVDAGSKVELRVRRDGQRQPG